MPGPFGPIPPGPILGPMFIGGPPIPPMLISPGGGRIPGAIPILEGGTILFGAPGPPAIFGLPWPIPGPLEPILFGLIPGVGAIFPIPPGLIVLGVSSKGLAAYMVSPGPGGPPIILGGPISPGPGPPLLFTGVAVFWLVLLFFLGLPPAWDPLGTLKFCGIMWLFSDTHQYTFLIYFIFFLAESWKLTAFILWQVCCYPATLSPNTRHNVACARLRTLLSSTTAAHGKAASTRILVAGAR